MKPRPNALQKFLHRFLMLHQVTAFFAPWVHRVDNTILKWTNGKYTVSGILGWNIIQLTTIGAKTAQRHTVPLVALFDGEKIALIASSFGRKHNPDWYYNLKAHPECKVHWTGRTRMFVAYETNGNEYDNYWRMAVSYYAGYDKYRARAAHRHIPVVVLEPKE
ncbi:MAG TPA: nitroreductase family deazaflavin-dependent oxidoreductase [Anaerolineales bacterium]